MSLVVDRSLRKARRHAKRGENALAAREYERILARYPNNRRAREGLEALRRPPAGAAEPGPSAEEIARLAALHREGRLAELLAEGEALAERFPGVPFVLNLLGAVKADMGRLDEAMECYEKALAIEPRFPEAHSNMGNALCALGRPDAAVESYQRALAIKPDYAGAHNNLGNALRALGRYDEALASYREALRLKPDYPEAHNNIGTTLNALDRPDDAVDSYRHALAINPAYAEAHSNLGNALKALGRIEEAIASYRNAIAAKPDYGEAHYNLGAVLNRLGRSEEAVAGYREAVRIKPDFVEAHYNLGNALKALGRSGEAAASYANALELAPEHAEAHNNLGAALHDLGRLDDAIASYRRALELAPDYAEAHNNVGTALNLQGRLEEAEASYASALRARPEFAEAHLNLSLVRKYRDDDAQIGQMLDLVAREDLSDQDRMLLDFGLAKALGDIGSHDRAFAFLVEGNRLRRQALGYDIARSRSAFEAMKSAFSETVPVLAEPLEPRGGEAKAPIFVLGMPRSGTTLVEQVLASHSKVHGAGEIGLLDEAIAPVDWQRATITTEVLRAIRHRYLGGLARFGVAEPFVTDKMPHNFGWIGFIATAMPDARIVHVKRDARATCWSIFKHFFSQKGSGFAYDLEDVTEYYKLYVDLMAFWHERFPGRIHDLHYERLTEQQEEETRRLLDHVGLAWEDGCLEFHKTERVVWTASTAQVRQKMYRGSSEEWRKYERHLGAMIAALEGY